MKLQWRHIQNAVILKLGATENLTTTKRGQIHICYNKTIYC